MYPQLQIWLTCCQASRPEANDPKQSNQIWVCNGAVKLPGTQAVPSSWLPGLSDAKVSFWRPKMWKIFSKHACIYLHWWGKKVSVWQISAQDWFQHQGKNKLSQNVIALLRCHSQILWCTGLREFVLQLHTFHCEGFWEVVFSLHSLQLITWALRKPSIFENSVSLLNQVETSQWTQKTLRMDVQLKQNTDINKTVKSFFRKSNGENGLEKPL